MFVNIITCSCNIEELIKNDVLIHINTVFGCCQEQNREYFVAKCENCPLNRYLFFRNYFVAAYCSCKSVNKKTCHYCRNLKGHLKYRPKKVCCEIENINKMPINIINLDKYLCDLKAGPFSVFNKEFYCIDVLIDHFDWVIFFRKIETD